MENSLHEVLYGNTLQVVRCGRGRIYRPVVK